jgi:hypothetical protein
MADDHNARYRSSDPSQHGHDPAAPASDPLAELARLIGRSDPFGEYAARQATPPQPSTPVPPSRNEPPRYPSHDPIPGFLTNQPAQQYEAEPAPRYSDSPTGHGDWSSLPPQHQPHHPDFDPFDLPPPPAAPAPPPSAGPRIDPRILADLQAKLGMAGLQPERARMAAAAEVPASVDPTEPPPLYPHDPMPQAPSHDDGYFEEEPRGRRRKGLLTVAAVLGLAVIGTAGAFGYRSIFGGPTGSSAPIIRASGEPSKVAPPPAKADQSANKFSYDRFGDRGQNEQVVVREEKPVDAQELARSTAPRNVFPPAPAPAAQPQAQAPATPQQQANAPSALGEPKRVRTVQIRPDQPEPSVTPQSVGATGPLQLGPSQAPPPSAPPRASAAQQQRVAARPATPPPQPLQQAAPPPSGNAPLSLAPESGPPPVSAPPPRAAAPAPRTTASAPPAGGGGYLVQVSSQRSEADAQSAYRSLQARHSSVLSGQPHMIRRADLGERGVYYRAMVGPFASREQAVQLCSSLKSSGGDCVVQSN